MSTGTGAAAPSEEDNDNSVSDADAESTSTGALAPQNVAAPSDDRLESALDALVTARESGQNQPDTAAEDKRSAARKMAGGTLSDGHESTVFKEPVKFKVLGPCTVRQGPEKDDTRVGEYAKGSVVEVVQEITNFEGLTTFQTITPGKGHQGGFVKLKTSKGLTGKQIKFNEHDAKRVAEKIKESEKQNRRESVLGSVRDPNEKAFKQTLENQNKF